MMARAPELPAVVHQKPELFSDFIFGSHSALITVLRSLSEGMGLTGEERFENRHRPGMPDRKSVV